MMRIMVVLWSVLATAVGVSLYLLKHEVRSLVDELNGIDRQIQAADENIHVLKAEWSYLNDPARLRRLVEAHLDLHELRPEQMTTAAASPMVLAALERSLSEIATHASAQTHTAALKAANVEKSSAGKAPVEKVSATKSIIPAARPAAHSATRPLPVVHTARPTPIARNMTQNISVRSVQ